MQSKNARFDLTNAKKAPTILLYLLFFGINYLFKGVISIARQRFWSDMEDKAVVDLLGKGMGLREIASQLNRSEKAVRNRCSRLHIDVCATKQKNKAESFSAVDVRCPFFGSFSKGKNVRCEGINEEGYILLGFGNDKQWMEHIRRYCNNGYSGCSLYKVIYGSCVGMYNN